MHYFDLLTPLHEKKKCLLSKSPVRRVSRQLSRDSIQVFLKRRLLSNLKQRRCCLNGRVLSYLHAMHRMALTARIQKHISSMG